MKLLAALLLLCGAPASAAFKVPGFELVYSYPKETTLSESDLRQAKDVWPEMIDQAKREIDLEEFYCTPRPADALEPTLQALERAGRRGVKIRVILEEILEKASADGIARLLNIPGLELKIADWRALTGAGIVHAKFFVVDRARAYVGSQNLDWRSLNQIHEMGLAIDWPPVVAQAQAVFDHDWRIAGSSVAVAPDNAARPRPADRSARAYLVASPWRYDPPGVGDSERELARLIGEAREEIDAQNLEYLPLTYTHPPRYYPVIDTALRAAAARGVKINLLVSNWTTEEPGVKYLQSLAVLPQISVRVITIPPAKEGPIPFARVAHSKYMVVDGKTLWLGTSNWRGGYLDVSRNLDVIVRDQALAARADAVQRHLWNSPYSAPLDILRTYPKPGR
ncbi:MAG: phospholipase [Elusimicrobia bacterium]|nr:phospholipase [Elusimicrobiota bacterium]MDE2236981.1 phospholipase [Elusimicrobiota bacterium]MDE2425218.1 phospholipase [Elusimicrobiota bacterium]